ncbi:MAG: GTP 3',8-cyclase MoaA [Rhodocyclaceae bacterium]|nr:GTP 3',8-cyclase MoaA [Rhodocyclaceae bacterium]
MSVPTTLQPFPTPPSPADGALPAADLVDHYGRRIRYLRLSVTDRCDFRCTYCMAEDMTFLPRGDILSLEECLRVVRAFVALGVDKVRLTGGEPLVRRDILWLIERASSLPGVRELVLTTNGSQLGKLAQQVRDAGVRRINVSIDSLRPERFRAITRTGSLDKVLAGIDAAIAAGFERIKLNTVMLRGVNDDEFEDLVDFAIGRGIDISFIEEMPLGDTDHARIDTFMTQDEVLPRLQARYGLTATSENSGGPARYWRVPGQATRVGFISPHSHNFCDSCNRVRVTATGDLYPCLGQNDMLPLLPVLRDTAAGLAAEDADTALLDAIRRSMGIKPHGHDFDMRKPTPAVVRFMSMTGG